MSDTPRALGGRVLSSSALVDYTRGQTEYTRAVVATAVRTGTLVLAIPASALVIARAEVPDSARPRLDRLCALTPCVVNALTPDTAAQVGDLLATASSRPDSDHVAAAHTVWVARTRRWPIITSPSAGQDLLAIDPEVELEHLP